VNGWPTPAALPEKSNVGWRDSLLKILPSQGKSYVLLLATFSNLPHLVEFLSLPSAFTSTLLAPSFP